MSTCYYNSSKQFLVPGFFWSVQLPKLRWRSVSRLNWISFQLSLNLSLIYQKKNHDSNKFVKIPKKLSHIGALTPFMNQRDYPTRETLTNFFATYKDLKLLKHFIFPPYSMWKTNKMAEVSKNFQTDLSIP